MSKFPNHGLFTRSAAASTWSSSLLAQSSRNALQHRSASTTTSHGLYVAGSPTFAGQAAPFIGPLPAPPSYNVSHEQDATAFTLQLNQNSLSAFDRYGEGLGSQYAAISPSALSLAAKRLSQMYPSHRPTHILDSASRLMTGQSGLPQSRGVHVFYPSLAAAPLLSVSATPSDTTGLLYDSPATLQTGRNSTDAKNSYVPLWHVPDSGHLPASTGLEVRTHAQHMPFNNSASSPGRETPGALASGDSVVASSRGSSLHLGLNSFVSNPALGNLSFEAQTQNKTVRSTMILGPGSVSSSSQPSLPGPSTFQSSHSFSGDALPPLSVRPRLASSTAAHDSSSTSTSGCSTPIRSNAGTPEPPANAVLGPSSVYTTGACAQSGAFDQWQVPAHSSQEHQSDATSHSPLWTQSFSTPRHRKLNYAFEHGAYGIPKRHPWAVVRGNGQRQHTAVKPAARTGAVGMLAAAADFLTGTTAPSGPTPKNEKLGGEVLTAEDGSRLGLNSPIREHGRIVQDRLESVQVGEDAYFLRPDSLGVADGVGGWASRAGADPALFSRLLMHFCAAELGKFDNLSTDQLAADGGRLLREWEQVDPVEVMHTAWERCVRASRREGILGSSTALIAVLRGDELKVSNLGDCVLLIVRAGALLFRSTEQQHSFNFPVQLGMMGYTAESVTLAASRTLARDGFLQSGASNDLDDDAPNPLGTSDPANNKPKAASSGAEDEDDDAEWDEPRRDAGRWTIKVQKGDIIIVGSDGLVDNLFDEDIVEEVLKFASPPPATVDASTESAEPEYHLPDDFSPQLVSEALCSRAKAVSEDSRAVSSPFQQRAMEEGLHYVGGKHDDISVVVAVVGNPAEQLARSAHSAASDMHHQATASVG